jgi:hypothetical protein
VEIYKLLPQNVALVSSLLACIIARYVACLMTTIKDNFIVHNVVYAVLVEETTIDIAINVGFASKLAQRINVLNSVPIQIARYASKIYTHWANVRNLFADI